MRTGRRAGGRIGPDCGGPLEGPRVARGWAVHGWPDLGRRGRARIPASGATQVRGGAERAPEVICEEGALRRGSDAHVPCPRRLPGWLGPLEVIREKPGIRRSWRRWRSRDDDLLVTAHA